MLHFIAGMPRAGGTVLCNILAQNPAFEVSGTSPLAELLVTVRNRWDRMEEARAMPYEASEAAKQRCLSALLFSFHALTSYRAVFDRSRVWLSHLEMVEELLGRRVKVIVPVRDVRDILSSLERLWRANPLTQIPYEANNATAFLTAPGRCNLWMQADGVVGAAYGRIRDAVQRGFKDRLHFVAYSDLTADPEDTLSELYSFLGEPRFVHDFEHIEQTIQEDDAAYGIPGLHKIEPRLLPGRSDWQSVLGEAAAPYGNLNQFDGINFCGRLSDGSRLSSDV